MCEGRRRWERAGKSAGARRAAFEPANHCLHLPKRFVLGDQSQERILAASRYFYLSFFAAAAGLTGRAGYVLGTLRLPAGRGAGALMSSGIILSFSLFHGWRRLRLPYLHKERSQILL
jgi:hypothetical protein